MKKVIVDESLLEAGATAIEQANVYLKALRRIATEKVATDEGRRLAEIAREGILHAQDVGILSQTEVD